MESQSTKPRDARIIEAILRTMGVDQYDPRVVNQLLELLYRYVSGVLIDARNVCEHTFKSQIDPDDIKLAIKSGCAHSFLQPPPREVTMRLAAERNSVPLPPVDQKAGVTLPPVDLQLTAQNFDYVFEKNPSPLKRSNPNAQLTTSPKRPRLASPKRPHSEPPRLHNNTPTPQVAPSTGTAPVPTNPAVKSQSSPTNNMLTSSVAAGSGTQSSAATTANQSLSSKMFSPTVNLARPPASLATMPSTTPKPIPASAWKPPTPGGNAMQHIPHATSLPKPTPSTQNNSAPQ